MPAPPNHPANIALPKAVLLVQKQQHWTDKWHQTPAAVDETDAPWQLVQNNHRQNFLLWHEEDNARDPQATDNTITKIKHRIDALNQQRNDAMEHLDEWVLQSLQQAPKAVPTAPLHSESVGAMVDRLSILSLKIYHMGKQTTRSKATLAHRKTCQQKLSILQEQHTDLTQCLDQLLHDLWHGQKRFKVYRQMKMYNDPSLSPVLTKLPTPP